MKLDPLYKWTGGKRKEIKTFSPWYPDFVSGGDYTYVEPFFGGGAVYWSLNAPRNIINDVDLELINFLEQMKCNPDTIVKGVNELGEKLSQISKKEKKKEISISSAKELRGEFYYPLRNLDRKDGLSSLSPSDRAFRFYVVNQLAFNGMRRFNSRGEFNVPYGNYRTISLNFTQEHFDLLQRTRISSGNYLEVIQREDKKNTFIYLDPPYTREFNEYSPGHGFGPEEQIKLRDAIVGIKNAKVMLIINSDDFTRSLYQDMIVHKYGLKYSTNIKNRFDNGVEHLVVCNY